MVRASAPMRVASFLLIFACPLLCQNSPWTDRPQEPQQRWRVSSAESLPEVPLPLLHVTSLPMTAGRGGLGEYVTEKPQPTTNLGFTSTKEDTSLGAWHKYLYPTPPKQEPHTSTSGSFVGRATYAASRILITRDDAGQARPNIPYFLQVLTIAAIHTSYRPYRERSTSATLNEFRSTIGGDAGINVLHTFEPDIRQLMKGISPGFVSRIGERIAHGITQRNPGSLPAR